MLWEARLSRDGFSIEAAIAKGRDLPDWYLDEPEVLPGDQFYMQAFFELSTCRNYSAMGDMLPIPWTAIVHYGNLHGLKGLMLDHFCTCVRAMDNAYMDWRRESQEKAKRARTEDRMTGNRRRTPKHG